MDLFDEIAGSDALRLDMEFDDGDIQILNNHWILHSRTVYEDFEEPERRRHLMRLWLACDDGPPFPPAMSESFYGLTLGVNALPFDRYYLTAIIGCVESTSRP